MNITKQGGLVRIAKREEGWHKKSNEDRNASHSTERDKRITWAHRANSLKSKSLARKPSSFRINHENPNEDLGEKAKINL